MKKLKSAMEIGTKIKRNSKSPNQDNLRLADWMAQNPFREIQLNETKKDYLQRAFAACGLKGWTANSKSSKETFLKKKFTDTKEWARQFLQDKPMEEDEQLTKQLLRRCPWFFIFLDKSDPLQLYNTIYVNAAGGEMIEPHQELALDMAVDTDDDVNELHGLACEHNNNGAIHAQTPTSPARTTDNDGTISSPKRPKTDENTSFSGVLNRNECVRENTEQEGSSEPRALRNGDGCNAHKAEMARIALERDKFEWQKQIWQKEQENAKELVKLRIEELKLKIQLKRLENKKDYHGCVS